VELTRGDASLCALQQLVERWNLADLSDATLGVGKDGKPKLNMRGPRSTVQHFSRLKAAVKEFDNAWHDANVNIVVRYFSGTCIVSLYRNLFYLSEPVSISSVPEFQVKHTVLGAKLP
jgi:hypothetical protein